MFRPIGSLLGIGTGTPKKMKITAATVIELGECLLLNTATKVGAAIGAAAVDGTIPLYISAEASASTDTKTEIWAYSDALTIFEVDIKEIQDATSLTCTNGDATSCIDDSLVLGNNDLLIGAVIEVVSMASGDGAAGTQYTVTDYVSADGDMTHASAGSTGWAAADTFKFVRLSKQYIREWAKLALEYSGSATTDGCRIALDQTHASEGFRVIGMSSDQKKLHVVLTASIEAQRATMG